jgi:hypothetical protein
LLVSRSPVHCVWPETFVTGRKAPADRIQPGVVVHAKRHEHETINHNIDWNFNNWKSVC